MISYVVLFGELKVYERPVIQSKLIFFCSVPKLAMKNHLCFVSNAVDCYNFIGRVAEKYPCSRRESY